MVTYHYFKFLNLQYWYCIIYSLLGGKCTMVDTEGVGTGVATSTISAPPPVHVSTNFWSWLFGGGSAGGEYAGPFAGLINLFAPIFAVIGAIVGFLWALYSALAFLVSGLLALLIIGMFLWLAYIRFQEIEIYGTVVPKTIATKESRSRWQKLLDRTISVNPREWREGILEADLMLGELLEKLGYVGLNTAERLRAVPDDAFVTLPNAWEAHRIKNFVSARSSNYILTQRETFRVMKLYEQVFEEFDFV